MKILVDTNIIIAALIKDIPYVACYLSLKCDYIWTNDLDFIRKKNLKIISTKELLNLC